MKQKVERFVLNDLVLRKELGMDAPQPSIELRIPKRAAKPLKMQTVQRVSGWRPDTRTPRAIERTIHRATRLEVMHRKLAARFRRVVRRMEKLLPKVIAEQQEHELEQQKHALKL